MTDPRSSTSSDIRYTPQFQVLQDETARILNAETRQEIYQAVRDSVYKLLDTEYTQLYLYSRRQESLTTISTLVSATDQFDGTNSDGIEAVTETTTVHKDEKNILWDIYTDSDGELLQSSEHISDITTSESQYDTGMLLPLGPYGVLCILEPKQVTFTDIELSIGEFLSAAVTRSLDNERRERGLEMAQTVSREAMTAKTHEEMAERILNQLPEVLDYPLCAIWEYNEFEHQLEPVATTGPAQDVVADHPTFKPGNSIAWNVFVEGGCEVVADTTTYPEVYNPDSPIKSEVITSIGDFGVFAAGSTRSGSFNETERQIIDSLSTNLQAIVQLVKRHKEFQLLDDVLGRVIRHNIRNELNVIKGNGRVMYNSDPDTEKAENCFNEFTKAYKRLEQTAENAQLMRKVVQNRSGSTPIPLIDVVKQAVDAVRSEHRDADIQFENTCSAECGEMNLHVNFQLAVEELIRNAVKHNIEGQQPVVALSVSDTENKLYVTVEDNGPGIPKDELGVLESQKESTLSHGSGAGLWVVDRVVAYSGGELDFSVGHGTTAEITFPKHSL